ncbi:MAG: chromosome segregation protein SMC [Rhodospirillaceae bacterium]|nr:chromosome segregation protein SMC [Rhodospirillaceae bacterium]
MVQFNKLRVAGFKSFVEPTELLIENGLTGIVGPNGCGKSNLVEALRWAMTETSAKAMRGGEMDDVIFGGTADRPARNIAEVTILLDNAQRRAPAQFNDLDELEVSRRIERSSGSLYRVNGREVRARDVALLFADASTGPRSTAIVSQGRIGAIVAARPTDRRALLEEAAGITGLHSRRHEAELRLRAAENNMTRLEDIIATLEGQHQGLKRQARQANRYRNLSGHIRRAEAMLLHQRWCRANEALATARQHLEEAERRVGALTGEASEAQRIQAAAAEAMPALRQAEATAAAEYHRLVVARDALDAEEARVAQAKAEAETRLTQIEADLAREQVLARDAEQAVARLAEERTRIEAEQEGEAAAAEHAEAARERTRAALDESEAALATVSESIAAEEARRGELARRKAEAEARIARLDERLANLEAERARLEADLVAEPALREARQNLDDAREAADAARERANASEIAREGAQEAENAARDAMRLADSAHAKLRAEADALAGLLATTGQDMWPPLLDQVEVRDGYEAALGAALGDDLSAPADEGAPVHWRKLPPLDSDAALPDGVEPLAGAVKAPGTLDRRLGRIGIVRDRAQGDALAPGLRPGQRLVSRDGDLWRWDGYTARADAATPAATRLAQRNRLQALTREIAGAEQVLAAARQRLEAARTATGTAADAARLARTQVAESDRAVEGARDTLAALEKASGDARARLEGIGETTRNLRGDHAEAVGQRNEAVAAEAEAKDLEGMRARQAELRAEVAERRSALLAAQAEFDGIEREAAARRQRIEAIGAEEESWRGRRADAERQQEQLAARRDATSAEIERLARQPETIAAQRSELLERVGAAETRRATEADRLAAGETAQTEADRALRTAEGALAQAREDRVRCEAAVEQGEQGQIAIAERIAERLECKPGDILEAAEIGEDEQLPPVDELDRRLERLVRERDNMGAVNLRAEQEAEELGEQIATLGTEKDDLLEAIERLRHGIAELNREGRERLVASFEEVNGHFQTLFTKLFGGGRAHLKLTDPDDPLEAGLEIMASPPGKNLQNLSLLSGGERALTAIALLFAVFLTNPAPICVLDEVDAPLDDANVDRFCSMLDEISQQSSTRFLLITHHRLTMARMDRLYGVTMPEAGVSQLVSVDLRAAEALQATA